MPKIGESYELLPPPRSSLSSKTVRLTNRFGEVWAEVRPPNSLVGTVLRKRLVGPVEPAPPIRPCPLCEDAGEIKQMADVPDEPWHRLWTGEMEPCPNCSGQAALTKDNVSLVGFPLDAVVDRGWDPLLGLPGVGPPDAAERRVETRAARVEQRRRRARTRAERRRMMDAERVAAVDACVKFEAAS
jgi:hypothetical protein